VRALIEGLGDVAQVIADADPARKAVVYADMGLDMTYRPDRDTVEVACAKGGVGGGT